MPLPWEPPPLQKPPSLGIKAPAGFGGGQNAAQVTMNTTGYRGDLGPGSGFSGYPPGFNPPPGYSTGSPNLAASAPFDYSWSLDNDPVFRMLQGNVASQNAAATSTAGTGFGQAFGQYGEIPDFAETARKLGLDPSNPLYSILMNASNNPDTQAAARNLTAQELSTVGGYNRQLRYGTGDLYDLMGQRGTLRSGATGVGLGQVQYADRARRAAGIQALLEKLTGIASAYNTSQQTGIASLQQGAQQAAVRQLGMTGVIPASVLSALNLGGS